MTWMTCPKCGAYMVKYTGYSACPMCGYKYPAQTITTTSGTNCVEVVRCKDCKHRPMRVGDDKRNGIGLVFPSERCPCQCDDSYYNWMPDDDWYCGNAERKEE